MYIQINEHDFREEFRQYNRADNFSYEALNALYDYFCELEDSTNPIELDVIAICCEYSEESIEDISNNYGIDCEEGDTLKQAVVDFLEKHTEVVTVLDDTVVYRVF